MTLSNIFFGKKVVQKAYLNNALIYESKGWQTLPSTCTEVWTKSYEINSNIGAITKDDSDNLYIGAYNTVYKVDPDGNLKWKCVTGNQISAIVVYPTYIYCSYYFYTNMGFEGHLAKIDILGNLLSDKEIKDLISPTLGDYFTAMQRDNENIYAITNKNYLIKLNSNLAVIDNATVPSGAVCLTTNNGSYVFVGNSNYGIRFDKNNFKNNTSLQPTNLAFHTTAMTMDNIGNLYLVSNSQSMVFKYDVESCKLLTTFSSFDTYALCTDYQENVYFVYYSDTYQLKKYSSDGTLIWDNVQIPTTNNNVKIITDGNGNIYVAYIDSNSMLTIRKLINLVKET